jgi:hypothetical protein
MIEGLFSRLAKVENDLTILTGWQGSKRPETKAEFLLKLRTDLIDATDFFDEKAIYFDSEIKAEVHGMVRFVSFLEDGLDVDENSPLATTLQRQAGEIASQTIRPVMSKLETKFRSLLAAEAPNFLRENKKGGRAAHLTAGETPALLPKELVRARFPAVHVLEHFRGQFVDVDAERS